MKIGEMPHLQRLSPCRVCVRSGSPSHLRFRFVQKSQLPRSLLVRVGCCPTTRLLASAAGGVSPNQPDNDVLSSRAGSSTAVGAGLTPVGRIGVTPCAHSMSGWVACSCWREARDTFSQRIRRGVMRFSRHLAG